MSSLRVVYKVEMKQIRLDQIQSIIYSQVMHENNIPHIESMTRTAQTVDVRCYGNCGGCNPTGGPNGGNYYSETERIESQRSLMITIQVGENRLYFAVSPITVNIVIQIHTDKRYYKLLCNLFPD